MATVTKKQQQLDEIAAAIIVCPVGDPGLEALKERAYRLFGEAHFDGYRRWAAGVWQQRSLAGNVDTPVSC